ncbi:TraG family conjugative transposon ATPase [Larkinella insperata]|uniref:TraG family conjugative transposon ATPase n=1 Tax=Larkinella insperata TaxID=332158 RepID=A0ABW3QC43_9BACT
MKLNARSLEKALPLLAVEDNCIISKMADITVGYKLQLPEIFTLAAEDYAALHSNLIKALKLLPIGTIVHKQDWFIEAKYKIDGTHNDDSFLTKAFQRHFVDRPYLDHYCYLYISKLPKFRQKQKSSHHTLSRRKLVPQEQMDKKDLKLFFDAVSQFERILQDAGMKAYRLSDEELVSGKGDKGIIPNYFRLQPDGSKRVVLEDWDLDGHVRVGDKEVLCFTLSDTSSLPQAVNVMANYGPLSSDVTPFAVGNVLPVGLLLPFNHVYNQYICIEDGSSTLKEFEQHVRHLNAFSAYSSENGVNRDWHQRYINEAYQQQRTVCRAHFNLMVWTTQPEKLEYLRNETASAIARLDCSPKQNTMDAARLLWAGIPGNAGDLPFDETFYTFTDQAVCFFNLETVYQSSSSPYGIRLCDRSGKPVWVDLSEEPMVRGLVTNRNKFVLGPTGSGKSFFMNHMVRQYYEQGTHIVMVDVGHSYQGTCQLINRQTHGKDGVYLTHDEHNPITFNPFYVEDGRYDDKIESITTLIRTLWKKESENTTKTEDVALDSAVVEFIKLLKKGKAEASFNGFYEFCDAQDGFRAYLNNNKYKDQYFDIEQFLLTMQPFYKGGKYDYLLNSTMKVDLLKKRFIVFELDNIKDHKVLFPIVTLIIMETFVAKISRLPKDVRKQMIIEEAWKAITKASMAEYIVYLFKTIRKHYGEAIVVTQEINDIIDNPIVKDTIISQSDCKILLNAKGKRVNYEQIERLVGLSRKQKELFLSLNQNNDPSRQYKEVFISLGNHAKVYATEVSPEEYAAYTTEAKEKAEVIRLMNENGGDVHVALTDFADARRTF